MKRLWVMLCFIIMLSPCSIAYAKENNVTTIKDQAIGYVVNFKCERAMLSRDGSEAIPIKNGTKLTKTGTYFLTLYEVEGLKIQTFTIKPQKDLKSWTINRESELDEILKYTLENFKTDITIKFNYGSYDVETLNTIIMDRIQKVINTYPLLTYNGGSITVIGKDNPTVQIKINYPLKVTHTLKQYNMQTKDITLQLLNDVVEPDMTDYEREKALFKAITNRVTYSKVEKEGQLYDNVTSLSHTMFAALVDQVAVCDGYAKSLMYLLNATGVPTQFVVGTAIDGSGHAWNLVKIEGDYYHVDSTWGDLEGKEVGVLDSYFNELDSFMVKTHTWDRTAYPKATTQTYTTPRIAPEQKGVYKVNKPEELKATITQIKQEAHEKVSLILYNDNLYRWQGEEILNQMVNILQRSLIYSIETKYDCTIISFNYE